MTNHHAGAGLICSLVLLSFDHIYILIRFPVMFNFMCQLDWVTGYPDIWSNILAVSIKVFLIGLTFKPLQADYSAKCGWGLSGQWQD